MSKQSCIGKDNPQILLFIPLPEVLFLLQVKPIHVAVKDIVKCRMASLTNVRQIAAVGKVGVMREHLQQAEGIEYRPLEMVLHLMLV